MPRVDGRYDDPRTLPGFSRLYYHIGFCVLPTQSTDPRLGCQPAPAGGCNVGFCPEKCPIGGAGLDKPGAAVCVYDPAVDVHPYDSAKPGADPNIPNCGQYNAGLLKPENVKWSDGPEAGMGVQLTYTGGSSREGCDQGQPPSGAQQRTTTVIVHCDPCDEANIADAFNPGICKYVVNITSIAGCPTNKPPPKVSEFG